MFPFLSIFKWTTKSIFLEKEIFPRFCPYMRSPPSGKMVLIIFRRFLNFGLFFGRFEVLQWKHKKFAPGNSLNFLAFIFGSLKWFFQNVQSRGLNWVGGAWYGIFLIRQKPALRACLIMEWERVPSRNKSCIYNKTAYVESTHFTQALQMFHYRR